MQKKANKTSERLVKRANQYDDGRYNYFKYWTNRAYEHEAEEMAIKRLLNGLSFRRAVDIGGGYGRLCILLENYAEEVTLAEPSQTQLDIADEFLKSHTRIKRVKMQADELKFEDESVDLVTMIRVMHHLPDPTAELAEIARILSKDGYFVLELANYAHARNRLKHILRGKRLPKQPVDIRSDHNRREGEIAFVNHNPRTVIKQLAHAGFKVEQILSVSNLRSPMLKKLLPRKFLLVVEGLLQPAFARIFFGPSIFFLVRKAK